MLEVDHPKEFAIELWNRKVGKSLNIAKGTTDPRVEFIFPK